MSGSKASTQANQTSTTTDKRVAADNGAIVLGEGARLEQLSDDVAIKAIESTTGAARAINADSLSFGRDVFDLGTDVVGKAIEGVTDTVATNAKLAESLSTVAIQNLEKNKRDAEADTTQTLGKYAAVAGTVIAAALILRRK